MPKPEDWCFGSYKETKKQSRSGAHRMTTEDSFPGFADPELRLDPEFNSRAMTATILRGATEDRELIDVCGFLYLDTLAANYTPNPELASFLERKTERKIVYIGFGSIVIPDPDGFTKLILQAVKLAGVRALISQGWGGLSVGDQADEVIDGEKSVMLIGNTPHDWLFLQVDAVVHHGGAGTTAAGLKAGCPTMVVPFFGDQPFWGGMCARMGVGAEPVGFKKLTAEKLAEGIKTLIQPEVRAKAEELGKRMCEETGVLNACRSIHRHLPLKMMTCEVFPQRLATHFADLKGARIGVCKLVMDLLIERGVVPKNKFKRRTGGFVKWNLDDVASNRGWQPTDVSACGWVDRSHSLPVAQSTVLDGTARAAKDASIDCGKAAVYFVAEPIKGFAEAPWGEKGDSDARASRIFKGFGLGIGKLAYYPLKGLGKALADVADGLRNTPNTIEGMPLESREKVDDVFEGVYRGWKALFWGIGEGVWDFFAKPVTVGCCNVSELCWRLMVPQTSPFSSHPTSIAINQCMARWRWTADRPSASLLVSSLAPFRSP